jgi:hypothetical protein
MLHTKDIKNIGELKNSFSTCCQNTELFFDLLSPFKSGSWKTAMSGLKVKGYKLSTVIAVLIVLPFTGQDSIHSFVHSWFSCVIEAQKDVFYRLLNNSKICWRLLLYRFVIDFNKIVAKSGNIDSPLKCLILDDSLLAKTGKKIEFIGRVWDHVVQRSVLGFKLLALCYCDATSTIPVDFSLHREAGRNKDKPFGMTKKALKNQYKKQRDKDAAGAKRIKELDACKIKNAIKMVKRAISKGLRPDYLLCDSWFTCMALIDSVRNIKNAKMHLIGMYKTAKTKFEYQGKPLTAKQIRQMNRKKQKRCKQLGLYYIDARVWSHGHALRMFITKKGRNGKWKVFLTTDTSLSFIKMLRIYQIRWSIEVFFKESKQLLGLGKCQSNDFDAQIAHTTMVMISHILLTLRHRFEQYETKGQLFAHTQHALLELRLHERLWGLLIELLAILSELFEQVDEQELIWRIINDQQAWDRLKLLWNPSHRQYLSEAA